MRLLLCAFGYGCIRLSFSALLFGLGTATGAVFPRCCPCRMAPGCCCPRPCRGGCCPLWLPLPRAGDALPVLRIMSGASWTRASLRRCLCAGAAAPCGGIVSGGGWCTCRGCPLVLLPFRGGCLCCCLWLMRSGPATAAPRAFFLPIARFGLYSLCILHKKQVLCAAVRFFGACMRLATLIL